MLHNAKTPEGPSEGRAASSALPKQAESALINEWVPHDIVLADAWFPLAHATTVTNKAVYRSVYSKPFWLWRDKGKAVATEYNPAGSRPREGSYLTGGSGFYPVIERFGYVWGWYGNPDNADGQYLPNIPFFPPNGGLPGYMRGTVRFNCTAALTLENLIDLTHADILHGNIIGDEQSESEEFEVRTTSETVTMIRHCKNKTVAPVMRWLGGANSKTQDVRQVIHIYVRSHVALIYGRFRPGYDVPVFHPSVPETRDRTRQDVGFNLTHAKGPFRYLFPTIGNYVAMQDMTMTTPQSARYAQATSRRDLHSRFDKGGQQYRLLMHELAARQAQGDFGYRQDGILSEDCSELLGIDPGLYTF